MSCVQRMRGRSATAFVKMNARVLVLLFLEALLVALATSASIGGSLSLDRNSLTSSGQIVFPKIPGINKPLLPGLGEILEHLSGSKSTNNSSNTGSKAPNSRNNVNDKSPNDSNPTKNNSTNSEDQKADNSTNSNNQTENNSTSTNTSNDNSQTNKNSSNEENNKNSSETSAANESTTETSQSTDGQSNSSSTSGLPKIPNVFDLIPKIPAIADPSSVLLPRIQGLPSLSSLTNLPDLAAALEKARNQTAAAIGLDSDLISGIEKAMNQAIRSINPTEAFRTLVNTILKVYQTVAGNCPVVIVGIRVLAEGIRLAFEVAKSARYIILG